MSANEGESRPALTPALTGAELGRWYWTLAELSALAREMGLSAGGGKTAVTARLAAALDGLPPEPAAPAAAAARRSGRQLAAPVDGATVIPPGQRCSQLLREFFVREIGPGFHFDAFMRDYVARGAGRTSPRRWPIGTPPAHGQPNPRRSAPSSSSTASCATGTPPVPTAPAPKPWPPGRPTGPAPATDRTRPAGAAYGRP